MIKKVIKKVIIRLDLNNVYLFIHLILFCIYIYYIHFIFILFILIITPINFYLYLFKLNKT